MYRLTFWCRVYSESIRCRTPLASYSGSDWWLCAQWYVCCPACNLPSSSKQYVKLCVCLLILICSCDEHNNDVREFQAFAAQPARWHYGGDISYHMNSFDNIVASLWIDMNEFQAFALFFSCSLFYIFVEYHVLMSHWYIFLSCTVVCCFGR